MIFLDNKTKVLQGVNCLNYKDINSAKEILLKKRKDGYYEAFCSLRVSDEDCNKRLSANVMYPKVMVGFEVL